eukprot:1328798-Lingulodinium_polyedra.AAC.1
MTGARWISKRAQGQARPPDHHRGEAARAAKGGEGSHQTTSAEQAPRGVEGRVQSIERSRVRRASCMPPRP